VIPCTTSCRQAEGIACRCDCLGEFHGADAEAQQLVLWAAPTPTEDAVAPEAAVMAPEAPPAQRGRARQAERVGDPWEDGNCAGPCGLPLSEVGVGGRIDIGRVCWSCLEGMWKAADALEARPVVVRVRGPRAAVSKPKRAKAAKRRARR